MMRSADIRQIYWLASAEHPNWAGPVAVTVGPVELDPDTRKEYVTLNRVAGTEDNEWVTVHATNRSRAEWVDPVVGDGCQVSVWIIDPIDPVLPTAKNPTAWCILYKTEQDARATAELVRDGFSRTGGW